MSAHTPGPWKAAKTPRKEDTYWYSLTVNAEHQIAKVYGRTITETEVDAQLIAAAPEMYEFLRELWTDARFLMHDTIRGERLAGVLRKAKGGA